MRITIGEENATTSPTARQPVIIYSTGEPITPSPRIPRGYFPKAQRRSIARCHFRRYFFRYFQAWYRRNSSRFALPLWVFSKGDRCIRLGVGNIPGRNLHFYLKYQSAALQDCALAVYWGTEQVDDSHWCDAHPRRLPQGYVCWECYSPPPPRTGQHLAAILCQPHSLVGGAYL